MLTASLLTCSPGSEVYSLYGHTALRLTDSETGADYVFNYGVFSFKTEGFVWKFVLGETDYELLSVPTPYFLATYEAEGRSVSEQVLNLTQEEARTLCARLLENARPENRVYRYNFLDRNCTTQAIDQVERALAGTRVQRGEVDATLTQRQIVQQYAHAKPWSEFAQDLMLGAEADRPATEAMQMFAPLYAERFMDTSVILSADGTERPLVLEKRMLVEEPLNESPTAFLPWHAASLVLLLVVALALWKRGKGWLTLAADSVLTVLQGLVGCVLCLLFFWSEHPTVGSNWLVLFFNPVALCYLPRHLWLTAHGRRSLLPAWQVLTASLTLLVGICGLQQLPAALYVLLAAYVVQFSLFKKFPFG